MKTLLLSTIAALAISSVAAEAATVNVVNYNQNVGTLDLGANAVYGKLSGSCDLDVDEPDSIPFCEPGNAKGSERFHFFFTVASGQQITGITLGSSKGFGPVGLLLKGVMFDPFLLTGAVGPINSQFDGLVQAFNGPSAGPLGARTYEYQIGVDDFPDAAGNFAMNWQVLFNVSPTTVPLPATAPLLLGALGLIAAARRRRTA